MLTWQQISKKIYNNSTMGKRSNKHNKKFKGSQGSKKVKTQWKCRAIPQDHPLFKQYYQNQLKISEEDFNKFWLVMKQKLPVVFRINPNSPNHEAFAHKINDEAFMKTIISQADFLEMVKEINEENKQKMQKQQNYQPKQIPKLQLIKWYPGDIVYTLNTNKQTFKKSKILSQFHKYLQKSFDSGLISRQELVSMLPPLYLNICSDDIVLDMCAAPGSKTSQLLEMIYGDRRWLAKGCVIANDADYSRAQMLIHQLQRSGPAGMAVINHPGQFLPELFTTKVGSVKQKFQFDKILCDVPCSGDGATRKIPIKWLNWHTTDAMVLHPLQLSILMKAINLLKKGGLIVYSTCSLNPIQNQAVINALFQKVAKGLQIIDIHPMYGVKGRRGLLNWKVLSIVDNNQQQKGKKQQQIVQQNASKDKKQKILKEYQTFQQTKMTQKLKQSMFPPSIEQAKSLGLEKTMRILPHDQNSGGFYVALLRKNMDFEWRYSTNQKKKIEEKGQAEVEREFLEGNLPEGEVLVAKEPGDDAGNGNPQLNHDQPEQSQQDQQNGNDKLQQKQQKQQNQNDVSQKVEQNLMMQLQMQQKKQNNKNSTKKKVRGSKYQTYKNLDQQQFDSIQKFYGLNDLFKKLLYVRNVQGQNVSKKVLLVSQGVRKFLDADTSNKIKLVNMGCQVFQRGKPSFAGNQCLYRLCQDGIHFILDHLQKRKVKITLQFFKKIIQIKTVYHEQIQDEGIRQKIRQMSQGSFCLYIDQIINGKHIIDALVGQNFKNTFHLLVSKEDQASLNIRYM